MKLLHIINHIFNRDLYFQVLTTIYGINLSCTFIIQLNVINALATVCVLPCIVNHIHIRTTSFCVYTNYFSQWLCTYLYLVLASRHYKANYFGQIYLIGSSINLAPLVYELKKDSGLSEFMEASKHVLRSIKANAEVSELFVS